MAKGAARSCDSEAAFALPEPFEHDVSEPTALRHHLRITSGEGSGCTVDRVSNEGQRLRAEVVGPVRRHGLKEGASGVSINISGGLLLNRSTAFQYLLGSERDPTTLVAGPAKPARSLRSEPWLRYRQLGEQ